MKSRVLLLRVLALSTFVTAIGAWVLEVCPGASLHWLLLLCAVLVAWRSDMLEAREALRLAEEQVRDIEAMAVRMLLAMSRGATMTVYEPDCECGACVAARARAGRLPS